MDLDKLRMATRPQHEATEGLMPVMGPELTREAYATVLLRLYPIVRSWEDWARAHAPAGLEDIVHGRQRAPLLEADLSLLGFTPDKPVLPFAAEKIPGLSPNPAGATSQATFLGAMYVMEGSTLGGQYIARQVEESLHLEPGQGDAYFRGYGDRTGEMWRAFRALLAHIPDAETDNVIAAAQAMFTVFGEQLRA